MAGQYHKYFGDSPWLRERGFEPRTLVERFEVGQYDNPARRSIYKGNILLAVRRWKDSARSSPVSRPPQTETAWPN